MTTIRATCPECGDIDLTPDDVRLEVVETLAEPTRMFVFECRSCECHVRGEASPEAARSLERAGVAVRHRRLPAEAREPHVGPPISEDELIEFGRWLHSALDPMSAFQHS